MASLVDQLALEGGDQRVSCVVDSRVTLCAVSKGRSAARALVPLLERVGMTAIAAALYLGFLFSPTRFNAADDPTRDRAVRDPSRPPPEWLACSHTVRWLLSVPPVQRSGLGVAALLPGARASRQPG